MDSGLPPIAIFVIRLFILFHDCGHGSFFRSKKANDLCGIILGIPTFTPYYYWRNSHARHHATSGNLDKRGEGDVWMMTVAEYAPTSFWKRSLSRFYRNPFVMFLLGPLLILLMTHRIPLRKATAQERLSVYGTDLGIILISLAIIELTGLKAFLLIQLPSLYIGLAAGIWLFYVQHQYEGVYWAREKEWSFTLASLQGASFYKLPAVLKWLGQYRIPPCPSSEPSHPQLSPARMLPPYQYSPSGQTCRVYRQP